jgi:hypothetical protein
MSLTLLFFGWWRPPAAEGVSGAALAHGRLRGELTLTARDLDDTTDNATRDLAYDLVGPGDVTGLAPEAVVHTFPARGAINVEHDKAVYAELAAPDLPWRYSVALPQGSAQRPWLALLVGTSDELTVQGSVAILQPSVLDAHPPARLALGAHVEQDTAHPGRAPVARLLSSRALEPDRDHRAVIVPAFDPAGQPAWASPAAGPVELPAYHHWTFRTRAGGDFAAIARRLRLHAADDDLGTAPLAYGPLPAADPMVIGGALLAATRPPGDPGPPGANVVTDVGELTVALGDATHPVLELPAYDAAWPDSDPGAPPTGWRGELRSDPRPRGLAGLGAQAGVHHQDLLAAAAARVAGAYEEAAERLRRLSLGLLASRALWRRRMPADGARRLTVLGPALRNVLSADGPVAETLQQPDRALGPALFSTAAKRAWRTAPVGAGQDQHDAALRQAAAVPAPPPRSVTSAAHTDDLARVLHRPALDDSVTRTPPSVRVLRATVATLGNAFDRDGFDTDTVRALDRRLGAVGERLRTDQPTALLPLLRLVDAPTRGRPTREQLRRLITELDQAPDSEDLAVLGARLTRRPATPAPRPLDLDAAAAAITAAFDPTLPRPSMVDRVADGIRGLDADPLAPQELLPELAMPAWRFLREQAPEWLLPGAGVLPDDSVVALVTNPAFVDAFLLGLNAQVLSELRFRNLPVLPGWTPIRTFWERAHPSADAVDDDILDIGAWPAASGFGSTEHQSPSAASADLVVLFNTPLFREYPGTLVYLVPAPTGPDGNPDWAAEPDFDSPLFPSFQGQLAAERVFFGFDLDPVLVTARWVVLEETVSGRRFWNAANPDTTAAIAAATDGAGLAQVSVTPPRRVLLRGNVLLRGLTP